MEGIEVSAKTVEDAVLEAAIQLGTTRDKVEYEVITAGSLGFLGIGSKKAVIRARQKTDEEIEAALRADQELEKILDELAYGADYGDVLRSKGMVPGTEGQWFYFDLVPEEYEIRTGNPDYTGKVCVIGANLKEEELEKAFSRS